MNSVSCFEVGFYESNACFRGVVVVLCDGGLINDRRLKAVTVERAIVLLSAVVCFVGCHLCCLSCKMSKTSVRCACCGCR